MSISKPPTVTFLMTDIKGSTALWERHPDAMPHAVAEHEQIIVRAVEVHGGRILKERGEGDSLFAVFSLPTEAMAAAMAFQTDLSNHPWEAGIQIQVRAAIHLGEAQVRDGDYYGSSVNRCARIREVAHGGQTLVSGSAASLAGVQGAHFPLLDLGTHRLRDLLEPESLFQLGDDRIFPPINSLTFLRNNLPHHRTSFIGREDQLARVERATRECRITTLVGPGGSGKTRLALQVAAEAAERSIGGTWLVELAPLRTGAQLISELGRVLGFQLDETGDSLGPIVAQLRSVSALLVFDNAEHLIHDLQRVVSIVAESCPDVTILVTSREPLGLTGEAILRIPMLSVPASPDEPVETMLQRESVCLFATRARLRQDDFQITQENCRSVGEICRKLEGIPLAIEQAAAMVGYMGPAEILNRLSNRLATLVSSESDTGPRHRTLEATIDWSFQMLGELEQRLMLALSAFPDSFGIGGIEMMGPEVGIPSSEAVAIAKRLIDKSLLDVTAVADLSRYRMLDAVREYASARATDREKHENGLVDYALSRGVTASDRLTGRDQESHVREIDADLPTFRKALEVLYARRDGRFVDLAYGLRRYWMRRGFLLEGRTWMRQALEFCEAPQVRAGVENALGAFCWQIGENEAAQRHFSAALALWEETGDQTEIANAANNLGILYDDLREDDRALASYAQAIEIYRKTRSYEKLRVALHNRGFTLLELGQFEDALECLEEALDLATDEDDELGMATVQSTLGELHRRMGNLRLAADCLSHALAAWRHCGDPKQCAVTLISTARVLSDSKGEPLAAQLVAGAERLFNDTGSNPDPRLIERLQEAKKCLRSSDIRHELQSLRQRGRTMALEQLVELGYCGLNAILNPSEVRQSQTGNR